MTSTITKLELADDIQYQLGIGKRDAKDMVDFVFDIMKIALENGDSIKISGFGNFSPRKKKKRPGRNPKTGEDIPISARTIVTWKPGLKLRKRVEESKCLKPSEHEHA